MKKLFFSLIIAISLMFIPKVYAESVNVSFASFWEESTNYGALINNGEVNGYWNTNSNVLITPDTTYAFVFSNANVCSGTSALIKGKFGQYGNANFNQLVDNVQMTYNNNTGYEVCSFTPDNTSSGQLYNFTCSMPQGNTNLFSLKFRTKNVFSTQFSYKMLIVNKLDITCGGSGATDTTTIENNQQTIINQNTNIINNQQELNTNITNDNTTGAASDAGSFFSGFTTNTHGLTSIITAPLTLIGSITSASCSPLGLPLPYINKTLQLPCMSSIYSQYFGAFFTLYQTITTGIIAYWVIVRILNLVKDFKNPEHDEIEVVDL